MMAITIYYIAGDSTFQAPPDLLLSRRPAVRQGPRPIPNFTSPPTEFALEATPLAYQDDAVIDAARQVDLQGNCSVLEPEKCLILFDPPADDTAIGVVLYGGGLVDPRSYSPLARALSEEYGFAVTIPIFAHDIAMKGCQGSGRPQQAAAAYPLVEKWLLAGHSLGGISAQIDLWANRNESSLGGLALLGSYIAGELAGCGVIDFSNTTLPAASLTASLDGVTNWTNVELGAAYLPENTTLSFDVLGGNHAQFGSYSVEGRREVLGSMDNEAEIPEKVQHDLSVGAIAHVAARMGMTLPQVEDDEGRADNMSSASSFSTRRGRSRMLLVVACLLSSHYILSLWT